MYLFLHLIIDVDIVCSTNFSLDDNSTYNNYKIKELGYILTNREFEIVEKAVMEIGIDNEVKEEQFIKILEEVTVVIIFESNLTLNILKKCLSSKNMNKVIRQFNTKCFYEIRSNLKSLVKKINRYGIMYPTINDVSMFMNCGEYIDSDSAENALNVIHMCCYKLYKNNNLQNFDTLLKKHEEKSLSKSIRRMISLQTLGRTLFTN